MVVVSVPFALTVVGVATMPPAAAGGEMNTVSTCVCKTMLSVVSVAVNVTNSGIVSLIEKMTAPFETLETPLAGMTVACEPEFPVSVTVLPLTVCPSASRKRTTTNASALPSAVAPAGSALFSETEGLTAPGVLPVNAR